MVDVHSTADGQDDPDRAVNISSDTNGSSDDDRSGHSSLDMALSYAARGWPVFPCYADGERRKQPITRHGVKDATTDPAKIRNMWMRGGWFSPGNYLVGVATGETSRIAVLDIDVKRAEANGFESLAKLGYPDRIATLTARTASGGEHLYFRYPAEGIGCTTGADGRGIGPGLDWRGDGGYVIAPSPGSGYEWYESATDLEPANVPADLMPRAVRPRVEPSGTANAADHDPVPLATLRGVLAWIDPGSPRNQWRDCVAAILNTPLTDGNEDDLRQVAHEWSCGDLDRLGRGVPTNYSGPAAVDTVLDTMPPKPDGVGFGTLVMYARGAGYSDDDNETDATAAGEAAWRAALASAATRVGASETASPGHAGKASADAANTADNARDAAEGQLEPWLEPFEIFGDGITREPILTRDMLPDAIGAFAADEAERKGITLGTVALPCLGVCAAAISDEIKILPRQRDTGWQESARLWITLVAPSGIKKSPALSAAKAPLVEMEDIDRMNYRAEKERYDNLTGEQKKIIIDGGGKLSAPVEKRYIVNDSTAEQLAHILAVNPQGLLVFRDELSGMIESFDAYRPSGQGKDRAAYLEAWNGGPYSIDRRAVDGTVHVPNWGFSILGGIQPGRMQKIIAKSGLEEDGFLQRFLLVPGDNAGIGIDRAPNQTAIDRYHKTVATLPKLVTTSPIRLSGEAAQYFTDLERTVDLLCDLPTTPGALAAWLRKLPGQFARMLLTYHAIEQTNSFDGRSPAIATVVTEDTARRVHTLFGRYLLPAAIQFYGEWFSSKGGVIDTMRRIGGYLLAKGLDRVTLRDLRDNLHLKADADKEIMDAMDKLDLAEWVCPKEPSRHDSASWSVNPLVHDRFAERAAQERQRRDDIRRRIAEASEDRRRQRGAEQGENS